MGASLRLFTPSLLDAAALEALFVGRDHVVDDLLERVESALNSESRAHRMLIGPRGAGKSHLISMTHGRIRERHPDAVVAWLTEDPWDIGSYSDFLKQLIAAATSANITPTTSRELRGKSEDELERALVELAIGGRPVIVLAENFDQILDAIGVDGQRRLRGFLENFRPLLLIVTSTRLTTSMTQQDKPFYSFFSTFELQPFSVPEAAEMLRRIAIYRSEDALAQRLEQLSLSDKYRLQAIDALAGGQPRVWAVFGAALSLEGLSDFAETLVARLDDLTPYYQEQLGRLSVLERKVVRTIAGADHAITVRGIAEELDADQKSLSKTITTLRRIGWVTSVDPPVSGGDRRNSYYELAEPLARIAFQLKDNRGEPLPLIVSFLALWFSHDELGATSTPGDFSPAASYVAAAIGDSGLATQGIASRLAGSRRTAISNSMLEAIAEALAQAQVGEVDAVMALPSAVRRIVGEAIIESGLEATRRRIIELAPTTPEWVARAETLFRSGQEESANALLLARLLFTEGRKEEGHLLAARALENQQLTLGLDHPDTFSARRDIAFCIGGRGDIPGALRLFAELLAVCQRILGSDHPDTLSARCNVAFATGRMGEANAAMQLFTGLLRDQQRILGPDHPDSLTTRGNIAFWVAETGETQVALQLFTELLLDRERVLGPDHPDTLTTRNNIAFWVAETGETQAALQHFSELLLDRERVLGPDHPNTRITRSNIAHLTEAKFRHANGDTL